MWWVVLCNLLELQWWVPFKEGIFMFWTTFGQVSGCDGPEMFCGPEMVELLCD